MVLINWLYSLFVAKLACPNAVEERHNLLGALDKSSTKRARRLPDSTHTDKNSDSAGDK